MSRYGLGSCSDCGRCSAWASGSCSGPAPTRPIANTWTRLALSRGLVLMTDLQRAGDLVPTDAKMERQPVLHWICGCSRFVSFAHPELLSALPPRQQVLQSKWKIFWFSLGLVGLSIPAYV